MYHKRLNGLAMIYISIRVIMYEANRNDGHPSCDHGLKRNTSSVDLCYLGLRTNLQLNTSITLSPLGSTP